MQDMVRDLIIEKGISYLFNYHITCDSVFHPVISVDQIEELIIGFTSKLKGVQNLIIIDPYLYTDDRKSIDIFLKMILSLSENLESITIFCNKGTSSKKEPMYKALFKILPEVSVETVVTDFFHDRFWLDSENQKGIVIGTSLNGIGKKLALIDNISKSDTYTIASEALRIKQSAVSDGS